MIITGIARRFLRMTAIAGYSGVTDMPGFRLTALPVSPSATLLYQTGMMSVRDGTAPVPPSALQSDDRCSAVSSNLNDSVEMNIYFLDDFFFLFRYRSVIVLFATCSSLSLKGSRVVWLPYLRLSARSSRLSHTSGFLGRSGPCR